MSFISLPICHKCLNIGKMVIFMLLRFFKGAPPPFQAALPALLKNVKKFLVPYKWCHVVSSIPSRFSSFAVFANERIPISSSHGHTITSFPASLKCAGVEKLPFLLSGLPYCQSAIIIFLGAFRALWQFRHCLRQHDMPIADQICLTTCRAIL